MSIMADKIKFDYMSGYKVISEGYVDPWVSPYADDDDDPEYFVERGYEIKHNGHRFKVWDWTFIREKLWKVEEYDSTCPCQNKWHFKGDFKTLELALDRVKELAE